MELRHRKPAKPGDLPDLADLPDMPEGVSLHGYSVDTALFLWRGYASHGLLPHAGGLLDQPRRWRRMIAALDDRADRVEQWWQATHGTDPLDGVDFSGAGGLAD